MIGGTRPLPPSPPRRRAVDDEHRLPFAEPERLGLVRRCHPRHRWTVVRPLASRPSSWR